MGEKLEDQIIEIVEQIKNPTDYEKSIKERVLARARRGRLTEEENPTSHFCTYCWPFNPKNNEVFIVAHKRSGLWLAPGGHMDLGESLEETRDREAMEELGVKFPKTTQPFMYSLTDIDPPRPTRACLEHFDIWYLLETDGADFKIDPSEFNETRWVSLEEAQKLLVDPANAHAVEKLILKVNSSK